MIRVNRYLIVDDDAVFRASLARYLCVYAEILEADTIKTAREKLGEDRIDAILLDKKLPDGDGLDLLPEIQGKQPTAAVVVVSGDINLAPIHRALDLGIDDYVIKSDHLLQDLLVRIPLAIQRKAARQATAILPKDLSEVSPDGFETFLKSAEKEYLERVLSLSGYEVSALPPLLGLGRSTLHKKLSDHGIKRQYREQTTL